MNSEPRLSRNIFGKSGLRRRATCVMLVGAFMLAAVCAPAWGQESPEGCNSSAVGVSLVPTLSLTPIPPETCVIPGQEITYRTVPFISPNPPPILGILYCDVVGGQLGVTFPNWRAAQSSGMLRPGQFVPVAGYSGLPGIPQYGNGDAAAGASNPLQLYTVPEVYVVEAAHADEEGFLNARSDYGQTSFLNNVGRMQNNGTVLGNPAQQTATATITNGLPLCVPAIMLEKTPSQTTLCDGVPTQITYVYMVTNISTAPPAQPDSAVPNLTNVSLTDDACDSIDGPMNDDGDGLLNPGETWMYTCTTTISTTTTNTATVTANAQAVFPAGQTIESVEYTDTAQATVTANVVPTVSVDPPSAAICAGASQELCAVAASGTPPYSFSWSGPGDFTADTECITVDEPGEYCVTVTDENGCVDTACATLTVNEGPEVSIDPPSAAICVGFDQQFCAVVTGTGPFQYAWTGPGGFSADTECITVGESGEYCVTVTDENGCFGSACAMLTVNENLLVSVTPPSAAVCAGETQGFCAVVDGGVPPFEYAWTGPGGFSADTACITAGAPGEYCVAVTDANGCSGSGCATLTVNENPQVSVSPPSAVVCEGETREFCAVIDGGTGPFEYAWTGPGDFSADTACITVGVAGEYCVAVTDANGCFDSGCATLTVNENPQVSVSPPSAVVCEGETQELCAVVDGGSGPYEYAWTGPGDFSADTECITVGVAGEYCVAVTDTNGCFDSGCASLEIEVCTAACCFPDGSCLELTEEQCAADGGDYQGDGSTCQDVSCPQPVACCFSNGTCQDLFVDQCENAGGEPQGEGSSCATVDCPLLKGACCLPLGGCAVVPEANCGSLGGAYQGDLTICVPTPCDPPDGACCLPDRVCIDLDQSSCAEVGGLWQGVGTTCADAMCFGSGACCFSDGSCEQRLQDLCQDAGGLYQGDGTNCVDVECVVTKGACCLLIGGCAVWPQAECAAAGGAYQGDLTTCVPFPCTAQSAQGCSRLYWRDSNHLFAWPSAYSPDTLFGDVFDDAFPGQTLLEVLDAIGGGLTALGGQTVAALLSAASPGVDCGLSDDEVVEMFNEVYPELPSEYGNLKDYFKDLSQQGCPLNGDAPDVPLPVTLGENEFDTNGAVTTEITAPDGCDMDGMVISNDVWRHFVADEPGVLMMSVCDSDFDTRIAVYDAQDGRGIACNDDACGEQSQASFATEVGVPYLIRIGGNAESGVGTLDISYVPTTCAADVNGDSLVNVDDLLAVIGQWGACPPGGCAADIDQDGQVGVDDLTAVVLAWGACDG